MKPLLADDADYNKAGRFMWIFFITGGFAAAMMVVMLLAEGGVTWFAALEGVASAVAFAFGASFEVARSEYRQAKYHADC